MAFQGKVISGDCHIDIPWLPADLFTSNAPSHLKEKMPRVVETEEGKKWIVEGKSLGWVAGAATGIKEGGWDPYVSGHSSRLDRMAETGFFSDGERGLLHPTTPELRVKDQDLDGVSGEVIYGILGLAGGLVGFETMEGAPDMGSDDTPGPGYGISDPEAITAVYGIYNEWLAAFCKSKPNRFAGLICINGHDPQLAANQVRSGAKNGLRGGEMNVATTVEPIYHRDWDVLWAAASETNMPISFHTTGLIPRMPNKADVETYKALARDVSSNQFQLSGAEYLSSIILSGACDRFPDLKFVLGECGVGWIPYLLHRMDDEYARHISRQNLSAKPTEFWYRQGYSTFQIEYLTNEMVGFIGEDNIMWGSDYPHPDGVWPDSRQVIEENLAHLNKRALKKIVCDNTARLYGFQN